MTKHIIIALMLIASTCQAESIRELGQRLDWNKGKQKDFILTVRYREYGTTFCPSFIVHPMEREEDFPKDMETVEMNEPGLKPR